LTAQELVEFPLRIDTVRVVGNEKTQDQVILREIPFNLPDTLDEQDILHIQNRIQNLFLFNQVQIGIERENPKTVMVIYVKETWYIYPVPVVFINDRDWSKWSYGFQLTHYNFRGMNEKLSLGGWAGYNPSFFINYSNPWIGRKARLTMGFSTFLRTVENRFFGFDEDHLGFGFDFGRRLSLTKSFQVFFNFQKIEFPEEYKNLTVSQTGIDYLPKYGLNLRYDSRDLFEFPMQGRFFNWRITKAGFTDNQAQFLRLELDHRIYQKIFPWLSIGARNWLNLNWGGLPIYENVFIGYGQRIRGYWGRVWTAQNLMLQHFEARIPVLPVRYVSWKNAPYFASFFQGLKYGAALTFFMDTGIPWNKSNQFALNNFYTGYGVGINFRVPYVYVLRLEFAINDRRQTQWIFDVAVSF
jgi:outer membrane protein assembly factor BamA